MFGEAKIVVLFARNGLVVGWLSTGTVPGILESRNLIQQVVAGAQAVVKASSFVRAEPARELNLKVHEYGERIVPRDIRSQAAQGIQGASEYPGVFARPLVDVFVEFVADSRGFIQIHASSVIQTEPGIVFAEACVHRIAHRVTK